MSRDRKRYAVVGTGSRATMFIDALAGVHADAGELVGFCDLSQHRMGWHNARIQNGFAHPPVPTFLPNEFDRMVREQRAEVVIVTTVDATHHHYCVRAMELGCDVITEKPMATDASKTNAILDAIERTGRSLRVAFNMRFTPPASKVYELIRSGVIGTPTAVDLSWLLNTNHGADYFRRWHREKDKSGGLLVHKSSHHFDLVNWWVGSYPETVFAMGDLKFYGRENAEARGEKHLTTYPRYTNEPAAAKDPFALSLESDSDLKGLYLDAEHDNGYIRDRNVFGDNITIEDTMAIVARYQSNVVLNYSLIAYSPWEGWRAAITGTKGRIEFTAQESSRALLADSANDLASTALMEDTQYQIIVHRMFEKPYQVEIPVIDGSHGGGDPMILQRLFKPEAADLMAQSANHLDGAAAVALGISANVSMETGKPVTCSDLFPQLGAKKAVRPQIQARVMPGLPGTAAHRTVKA